MLCIGLRLIPAQVSFGLIRPISIRLASDRFGSTRLLAARRDTAQLGPSSVWSRSGIQNDSPLRDSAKWAGAILGVGPVWLG